MVVPMTNIKPTLLSDIVSVERFAAEIAAGRIQERSHPADPDLRIYSYTKLTQFGGLWTPESRLARGLIVQVPGGDFEQAVVKGRGLPKFFTVSQIVDSDWGRAKLIDDDENVVVDEAPEIPWHLPATVAEKLNGALGLGYIDSSGRFRISTKGSFDSLEARVSNRVLDTKYAAATEFFSRFDDGTTMLFEIITPERPHPVDYGNLEDLIFLGTVEHGTGNWTPAQGDEDAVLMGFPFAQTKKVKTLREAVDLPYEDNTEGFVVTVVGAGPEAIYKVKPGEYLRLRKLFYALQENELKELVSTREFTDQLDKIDGPGAIDLSVLVGDLKLNGQMEGMLEKRRAMIFEEIVAPAQRLVDEFRRELLRFAEDSMDTIGNMPRGEVATWINQGNKTYRGLFFAAYDSLLSDEMAKVNSLAVKFVLADKR